MQELSEIERDLIAKVREGRRTRFAERAGAVLGLLMIVVGFSVVIRFGTGIPFSYWRSTWGLTVATLGILAYYRLNNDPMHKPLLLLGGMWFGLALLHIAFDISIR